ncbi:MAG: hypothetical protein HRT52_14265 [Colwellia sp.]|nr:hypothetical protein [Colwellia sp.]
MSSYIVGHLSEEQGPVTSIYKEVRKVPFSYTSKKNEAELASEGSYVYVIEKEKVGNRNVFKLAYSYKCTECFRKAGGKWLGKFDYKNTVKYEEDGELKLLDPPLAITDSDFISWYKTKALGMRVIPTEYESVLKAMLV